MDFSQIIPERYRVAYDSKGDRWQILDTIWSKLIRDVKLRVLYKEKPDFKIKILDGGSYKILSDRYSDIIKGWEK